MAFEYGSDALGIRNPFRIEGAIRTASGLLISALGLYATFTVKSFVESGDRLSGWLTLAVAVSLLLAGVSTAGRGIFQIMRYFVGRGAPTSLSTNVSKSEIDTKKEETFYEHKNLEQMLQGRKNLTFAEPLGWLTRLIYSVVPRLLYLPHGYRNLAQEFTRATVQTVIAFLCLGFAWFSGTTGLTTINQTPVMDWLALVLLIYVFGIWWQQMKPPMRKLRTSVDSGDGRQLVAMTVGAVLLPFALALYHENVRAMPELPFNTAPFNTLLTALALLATALIGAMLFQRSRTARPLTEVSEYRDNWQESLHPQEIFIHFENSVMANRRYKEVPNRIYRDFDANLFEEGSADKGNFLGEMIQETQPVFHETDVGPAFKLLRVIGTSFGQLLLVLSAVWLYRSTAVLAGAVAADTNAITMSAFIPGLEVLLTAAILLVFGRIIANAVHVFWAEIQFKSLLVYFQCRGTYTESRLRTGKGVYDSTESENILIRSSMHFWVLASQMITSTFSASGQKNLESARLVLELEKANPELNAIIDELRQFAKDREAIASINNEKDLAAASRIFQVNQQTRMASPASDDVKAVEAASYRDEQLADQQDNPTEPDRP